MRIVMFSFLLDVDEDTSDSFLRLNLEALKDRIDPDLCLAAYWEEIPIKTRHFV